MNTRESEIARKLTSYLDHGTADLKAGIVYRLQQARAEALARLVDPQPATSAQMAHALAGATGTFADRRGPWGSLWLWLALAVFAVVAGFGWQQWQSFQQAREFEEIDAQILVSDLPIDAYVDLGL